jgi:hypothetical protein
MKMARYRGTSALVVVAAVTAMIGLSGCKKDERPKGDHPEGDHPTKEQVAPDHPAGDHPAGEHPSN